MNNSLRVITVALILLTIIVGCKMRQAADTKVNELAHFEQYKQIVDKYSKINLCNTEDTSEVVLYINALIETGTPLPKSLLSDSCPSHIKEFALGYYDMLHGELNDSLDHFIAIKGNINSAVWLATAILEHSLYTDDFSKYEMSLQDLKNISIYDKSMNDRYYLKQKILPYYESWYLLTSGELKKLRELLIAHGNTLDPYEKSILEIELYLRRDEFDAAEKLINDQLKKYPKNQELLELKGKLIRLTQDDEAWVVYLKKVIDQYPKMWIIKANYAVGLIELGQKEKGLELLEKIANQRPFDYEMNLIYADYSLLYGKPTEMDKVQKILNNKHYIQLPYFHVIWARIYSLSGEMAEMEKQLEIAKALNPYADYVLWFEFNVLNESAKYKEAEAVLDKILKQWPNDVDALREKYAIAVKQNETNKAQKIENLLLNSKRYIPPKYIDEINSTKKKHKEK